MNNHQGARVINQPTSSRQFGPSNIIRRHPVYGEILCLLMIMSCVSCCVPISGGWENAVLSQGVEHLKPGTALEAAALLGFSKTFSALLDWYGLVTCRVFHSSYAPPTWDMGH